MSNQEKINLGLGDFKNNKAFSHGPSPREPRDAELLDKALDPHTDVLGHLVIRGDDGSIVAFKPGVSRRDIRKINYRVNYLLKYYNPTTQEDDTALRSALHRFGVERELPAEKRERTR